MGKRSTAIEVDAVGDRSATGLGGLLLVAAPLLWALGACASTPGTPNYEPAEQAMAAEDWDRAASLWYEIHLAEEIKSERTFVETSRALYEAGDCESACALLRRGRQEHPRSADLLELHGRVLECTNYTRAAEDVYSSWATLEPDSFGAHVALGRVRLSLGWEIAARSPLQRAAELDTQDPEPHILLASLFRRTESHPVAFDHTLRAIELGADSPQLYVDGAITAMHPALEESHPGAPGQALDWMILVCERQPQNTRAHFLRGVHLESLERKQEAIEAFLRAVETDPACLLGLRRLATLFNEAGEVERTREIVARALEIEEEPFQRERLTGLLDPK